MTQAAFREQIATLASQHPASTLALSSSRCAPPTPASAARIGALVEQRIHQRKVAGTRGQ